MNINCKHCNSIKTRKNGKSDGRQRYICNSCKRTFSDRPPAFDEKTKQKAVQMVLNGVGIRKTALLLGASHVSVLRWLKRAGVELQAKLSKSNPNYCEETDIIEMDEIYTFVQKRGDTYPYGQLTPETKGE